jgi:hypothetical protein
LITATAEQALEEILSLWRRCDWQRSSGPCLPRTYPALCIGFRLDRWIPTTGRHLGIGRLGIVAVLFVSASDVSLSIFKRHLFDGHERI